MAKYDNVIVGAASAGCVLAARLSERSDIRVLLLEARGRDRSPNIKIPAAFGKQFHVRSSTGTSRPSRSPDAPAGAGTFRGVAGWAAPAR